MAVPAAMAITRHRIAPMETLMQMLAVAAYWQEAAVVLAPWGNTGRKRFENQSTLDMLDRPLT